MTRRPASGPQFLTRKAARVDFSSRPFRIWTESPEGEPDVLAQVLIVATGAQALMFDVPGEARLMGHGVSTCATCDGFFFRNQKIVVVGGGDSALEEASFLTRFGESVTVVHRRKELRASKIMQDRAFANDKIEFVWDSVVTEVHGDGKVSGVALTNIVTGEQSTLDASGVFVAIGHVPNTSVFAGDSTWTRTAISAPPTARDQRRRRVRVRRRPGPHLPPGHHRGGLGVHGRHRRRALARSPGRGLIRTTPSAPTGTPGHGGNAGPKRGVSDTFDRPHSTRCPRRNVS